MLVGVVLAYTAFTSLAVLPPGSTRIAYGCRSTPEEFVYGQEVGLWATIENMGSERGYVYCRWINVDTGEELGISIHGLGANRLASLTTSVIISQSEDLNVRAECGPAEDQWTPTDTIDDTCEWTVPMATVIRTVVITIYDSSTSIPIEGAEVTLGFELTKTTIASGKVTFNVAPGSYAFMVKAHGYQNFVHPDPIDVRDANGEWVAYLIPIDPPEEPSTVLGVDIVGIIMANWFYIAAVVIFILAAIFIKRFVL